MLTIAEFPIKGRRQLYVCGADWHQCSALGFTFDGKVAPDVIEHMELCCILINRLRWISHQIEPEFFAIQWRCLGQIRIRNTYRPAIFKIRFT